MLLCRTGPEVAQEERACDAMLLSCCCRIIRTKVQQPFHPTPDGAGTGVTAPGHTIGKRAEGRGELGPSQESRGMLSGNCPPATHLRPKTGPLAQLWRLRISRGTVHRPPTPPCSHLALATASPSSLFKSLFFL